MYLPMEIKKPDLMGKGEATSTVAPESSPKKPGVLIFVLVLLAAFIALAFYLSFAKAAMMTAQTQLDSDIAGINQQIQSLKDQKVEAAQFAQMWLIQLEKDELRWSKVIKSVQDLIPLDVTTQKAKIKFLSYSGAAGGKLTLNAQTMEGSADPFSDVAELVRVFNSSSFFKDAYIPSITRGLTEKGDTVLSFAFIVSYQEKLPGALSTSTPTSDAVPAATKVPRKSS